MKLRRLEIDFPIPLEVTSNQLRKLSELASEICRMNEPDNYCLWPCGEGLKITYMPITKEDEEKRPAMEFDENTYHIECTIREASPEEIARKKFKKRPKCNCPENELHAADCPVRAWIDSQPHN